MELNIQEDSFLSFKIQNLIIDLIIEDNGDLGLVLSNSKKVLKSIIYENASHLDSINQIKGEIYETLKTGC